MKPNKCLECGKEPKITKGEGYYRIGCTCKRGYLAAIAKTKNQAILGWNYTCNPIAKWMNKTWKKK